MKQLSPASRRQEPTEPAQAPSRAGKDAFLTHPRLARYWPSEREAVRRYAVCLGVHLCREVAVEEVVWRWEEGPCRRWRRRKMRLDGQMQLREIERHKYLVSQRLGYDVGWEEAAHDWIERHAHDWRAWWESQDEAVPPVE